MSGRMMGRLGRAGFAAAIVGISAAAVALGIGSRPAVVAQASTSGDTPGISEPEVFIYEEIDSAPAEWSGLVTAEFYRADGTVDAGPKRVDIEAAIEWGRERARIVTVRLDEALYAAGEKAGEGEQRWGSETLRPYTRPIYETRGSRADRYLIRATFSSARYSWPEIRKFLLGEGLESVSFVSTSEGDRLVVTCVAPTTGDESLLEWFREVLERLPSVNAKRKVTGTTNLYEFSVLEAVEG